MSFDVQKMVSFCAASINAFAKHHSEETFYAFAIDASLLCLNSEEQAVATLKRYQERWHSKTRELRSLDELSDEQRKDARRSLEGAAEHGGLNLQDASACLAYLNDLRMSMREVTGIYSSPESIRELRENTGDWAYQGFARMREEDGFDDGLYRAHYAAAAKAKGGHAPNTDYARSLAQLVNALVGMKAFSCLKLTADFKAQWVDHDY